MRSVQREKFWELSPGVLHMLQVETRKELAIWKTNIMKIHSVRKISGCQGMESDCHRYRVSFGRDENVLELDNGNRGTTLYIYKKPLYNVAGAF